MTRTNQHKFGGYSLLEVLAALMILVIGLTSILTLSANIRQKSVAASELAAAEVVCQTTLNELLASQAPIRSFSARPLEGLRHWYMNLVISECPKPGLAVLHISAYHQTESGTGTQGKTYQLMRWVSLARVVTSEAAQQSETENALFSPLEPPLVSPMEDFADPF